ncbi:uncharacterized protein LOC132724524 isoform X2 [Ruditapes philippinarum]|nr:uncharacterized protein LOC132724524 isoform X2 [Ruditapes philippinarum]
MVMENGKQDCVALEEPLVQQISNGDQELALKIMKAYNENARPAGESLVVSIIVPEVGPLPASSPTPTLSATVCDTSSEESQCKSNQSQVHQWKESEERLLIDKRASLDDKFNQTKSHNVLWNQIQTEMEKEGVQVSAQQIKDKWKNLKRKYMEIVDLNGKTGNCRNTCKYFDIFSQLYGTKASTKPSFVLDTSNTESAASEVNVENEVQLSGCYLDTLPNDILLHILVFLNVTDLIRLQFVSKRFYHLCVTKYIWQFFTNISLNLSSRLRNAERYLQLATNLQALYLQGALCSSLVFISRLTKLKILVIHGYYTRFDGFDLLKVLYHTNLIGLDISGFKVNLVCLFEISRKLPQLQALRAVDLGQSVEPYILEAVLLNCSLLKSVDLEPCGSSLMWADIVDRYSDINFSHLILDYIPALYLKFARCFYVFPRVGAPDLKWK